MAGRHPEVGHGGTSKLSGGRANAGVLIAGLGVLTVTSVTSGLEVRS